MTLNKLLKNWGYLFASDTLVQIFGFIATIILARKLGPTGFGLYSVFLSSALIFSVFSNFGMNQVIIRKISLTPSSSSETFNSVISIRVILFFFAAIILYIYDQFFAPGTSNNSSFIVIFLLLSFSIWDLAESIAFGHKITKISAVLNAINIIMWATFILLYPKSKMSPEFILLIYVSLHFLKSIVYLIIDKSKGLIFKNLSGIFTLNAIGIEIFKTSFLFFLMLIIATTSNQLPIQLLNINADTTQTGLYSVSHKVMIPIAISVNTLSKAVFPFLTELYAEKKDKFKKYIKEAYFSLLLVGSLIAFIASVSSPFWFPILFGNEYLDGVIVFNIIIWYSIILITDSVISISFISSFNQKSLFWLAVIDIIIIIPLLFFGSYYGALGMAFAKVLAGAITLIYHWFYLSSKLSIERSHFSLVMHYMFGISLFLTTTLLPSFWMKISLGAMMVLIFFTINLLEVKPTINNLILRTKSLLKK